MNDPPNYPVNPVRLLSRTVNQEPAGSSQLPANGLYAVVLGIAQDAGLPHVGCRCPRCLVAQSDPAAAEYAAAIAIVDARHTPNSVWLIDATPDIKFQLDFLAPALGPHPTMPGRLRQPDGLFLTHAHMGHTAGLAQLGTEGMNVRDLPVYASDGLVQVLRKTALWRPLLGNLRFNVLPAGVALDLAADLGITPMEVPHRDEVGAGSFAFRIQGPGRSLLYVPDIDDWGQWARAREVIAGVDVTLADASFYSVDELAGRPPVAHPLVPDTVAFFAGLPGRLILTHLNHTNRLLDRANSARAELAAQGVTVARFGQIIPL
jgi:pyrroloquinoline quinone biosynthesis protein B